MTLFLLTTFNLPVEKRTSAFLGALYFEKIRFISNSKVIFASMSPLYKILYLFEASEIVIMEIMRTDKPDHADVSEIYHWLYLEKKSCSLIKLWFRSMDSSSEVEERYFEQGYLKFNLREATYIEKYNSSQYKLVRQDVGTADRQLNQLIESYLKLPQQI
ncbi:hypothetical protein [Pedobacter sandarakinus]|uniref:hypothetical protein n=1 Tax=Pedobacter sandarakinus TaxID=353156 RepID=UPI0022474C90|nr:hypothetical protein [Pedobacter sandarakinus]MCX2574582.1 hypothetical protein [Pedobacter sandarakinus]